MKYILALMVLLVPFSAQQTHPLSEITPIDTNLNMGGYDIVTTNLTASGNVAVDTDVLYVDAVSNEVGIGTSNPVGLFQVNGGMAFFTSGASDDVIDFGNDNGHYSFQVINSGDFALRDTDGGNIPFVIVNNAPANSLYLDGSGNVGVEGKIYDITDANLTINDNLVVSGTGSSTVAGNLGVEGNIYDITDADLTINDNLVVSGTGSSTVAGTLTVASGINATTGISYINIADGVESLQVSGVRGTSDSIEQVNLYNRLSIGYPSGWNAFPDAPAQGLYTHGGAVLAGNSGSVGIGTTTPDQKLQVIGNVMIGETDTTGGELYLYGTTAGAYSRLKTTNGNLHIDSGFGGTSDGLYLNYYNGGTIYFGTGATGYHSSLSTSGNLNLGGTLDATGDLKFGTSGALTSPGNYISIGYNTWVDDTSYEYVNFYSGASRKGIILWDGSWSNCLSSTSEWCVAADSGFHLTLSSESDVRVRIDADNNGAQAFRIYNGAAIDVANIDESGNMQIDGDFLAASGGVHVGGTSDPGTDNLVVDGQATIGGDLIVQGQNIDGVNYLNVEGSIFSDVCDGYNAGHFRLYTTCSSCNYRSAYLQVCRYSGGYSWYTIASATSIYDSSGCSYLCGGSPMLFK